MAMKRGAYTALALLLGAFPGRAAPPAQEAPARPQRAEVLLVGVLTQQFTPGCENGQDVWREPSHYEIGFVRVQLPAGLSAGPLLGKVVAARGAVMDEKVPPHRVFDNGGLCSVMQMRSDWVVSKEGIRLSSERGGALGRIGALAATAVRAVDAPTIERSPAAGQGAEQLTVRFRNPLDRPLSDLRIAGHYEGCYGKPGASERSEALGAVAAGATAEVRLPRLLTDEPRGSRRSYRLHSLRLRTSTPGVAFDLDVPVGHALSDCPRP